MWLQKIASKIKPLKLLPSHEDIALFHYFMLKTVIREQILILYDSMCHLLISLKMADT